MGMRINTNVEAFTAQRNLQATSASYAKSVEKLSSGLRINGAGDDAAGLSISEKLRSQTRGLAQAQRNAQDGISLIQTGEGALNETHSILQRINELAVQASNGTLSADDQKAVAAEFVQLQGAVDGIGTQTQFNGIKLLNGGGGVPATTSVTASGGAPAATLSGSTTTYGTFHVKVTQVGTAAVDSSLSGNVQFTSGGNTNQSGPSRSDAGNNSVSVAAGSGNVNGTYVVKITGTNWSSDDATSVTVTKDGVTMANATFDPITGRADFGNGVSFKFYFIGCEAVGDTYQFTLSGGANGSSTMAQVDSGSGYGVATAVSGPVAIGSTGLSLSLPSSGNNVGDIYTINASGGYSSPLVNLQVGANAGEQLSVGLKDMRSAAIGSTTGASSLAAAISAFSTDANASANSGQMQADAQVLLRSAQQAISDVSTQRASFGASQNRLEHTISNLGVAQENTLSAESRIRDVDMAAEMVTFTKTGILQQAGQAILAQANQAGQGVLSLLRG